MCRDRPKDRRIDSTGFWIFTKDGLFQFNNIMRAFTAMEGMAGFAIENILKDDQDFQNYLTTFMGTDFHHIKPKKKHGKRLHKDSL